MRKWGDHRGVRAETDGKSMGGVVLIDHELTPRAATKHVLVRLQHLVKCTCLKSVHSISGGNMILCDWGERDVAFGCGSVSSHSPTPSSAAS